MEYPLRQLTSEEFPPLLQEIADPPKQLMIRGTLPSYNLKWLAVVGSRKYTSYGKAVCERLISDLRGAPIVVVSGLALGIDCIVHKTALDAGLPCVAIPGSGLDWNILYPRSNQSLAHAILKSGGVLLSEFEENQRADQWTFPQRNRIMAGISHATLLIEAEERSGTLITARLATEYNRELLAVPGSIFSANTVGTHQFLKLGARMVTSAKDILDTLGLASKTGNSPDLEMPKDLTENESKIFALLSVPRPRDELLAELKLNATDASIALSTLEIKMLVVEELGLLRRT